MPITIHLSIVVSKLCKQNKPMVMTLKSSSKGKPIAKPERRGEDGFPIV